MYDQLRQIIDTRIMILSAAGRNLKSEWNGPESVDCATGIVNTQFQVQQIAYTKITSWT